MSHQQTGSSRSTVYVSNLPFDLTNIDVRKLFEKHGQIVRVTVLRDRQTRKSKGVAFILFSNAREADQCCGALDNVEMFGRTLKASIAKDNGKGAEFGKRREYPDKSRCYECGELGHMSYSCPRNVLGDKSPPRARAGKRSQRMSGTAAERREIAEEESDSEGVEDDRLKGVAERQRQEASSVSGEPKRVKYKKSAYFSDDEEVEEC